MKIRSVHALGSLLAAALATALLPSLALAGGQVGPMGDSIGRFQGSARNFAAMNENTTGASVFLNVNFGPSGEDLDPVPNDFNSNGVDTVAVYSHVRGTFFLANSNQPQAVAGIRFGGKDRQPPQSALVGVSGNWDGAGADGIGLYDPDAGTFALQNVPQNGGQVDASFSLGNGSNEVPANDGRVFPLSGDFNDNGTDTAAIYNQRSGIFTWKADNTSGAGTTSIRFGGTDTNNLPFACDNDNDGVDEVGLYNPDARTFTLATENVDGGGSPFVVKFGGQDATNVPICGNWDGS